jgi:acyl-CoA synthetase (AMP-forming)/AMP-acid ligase II
MIHRSTVTPVELPAVGIHQLILDSLQAAPDYIVLIEAASGRAVTAGQLADQIRKAAQGLMTRGIGAGDVVAIIAPNCLEYPVAFLATAALGAVACLPNPLGTGDDFTLQLRRTRAKLVVTAAPLLDKVRPAAAAAGIAEIVVFGEAEEATPFVALLESAPLTRFPAVTSSTLVALPFSSGTSGRPKAVMLTHQNLVANAHQFATGMPLPDGIRLIAVLPFFHIYGLVLLMIVSLWRRRTLVVMPRFELEPFLEAIARHRVELAPLVPPIMVALAKHPAVDRYDLSSLKLAMCGAAPLGADVEEAVAKRLGIVIGQGYGMTEVCGASHLSELRPGAVRRGAVGTLVPHMEARIVDPATGRDRGPNERGELWLRGPNVMAGYLDDPDSTAACLDGDRWLRTGDIAYVDDQGYFYIVDRLKELIKYKGHQVAPADLEAILLTHPSIADAAVIPSPDDEAGEVPKAFVVLKSPLTADEVIAFVAGKVAPMEKVRRVEFVEAIPKSPSGKILRRMLVERERAAAR